MTKPKNESTICATCGHDREHHWKRKGSCRLETGKRFCGCSHFRRIRWGKIRRAIVDSLHSTIWGVCERFTETNLVVVRRTDILRNEAGETVGTVTFKNP